MCIFPSRRILLDCYYTDVIIIIFLINSVCIYHRDKLPICILGLSNVLNSIIIGKFNLNQDLTQIIILNEFNFAINWC